MKDEEEKVNSRGNRGRYRGCDTRVCLGLMPKTTVEKSLCSVPRLMHRRHYAVSDFVVRRFLIVSAPKPTRNTAISHGSTSSCSNSSFAPATSANTAMKSAATSFRNSVRDLSPENPSWRLG